MPEITTTAVKDVLAEIKEIASQLETTMDNALPRPDGASNVITFDGRASEASTGSAGGEGKVMEAMRYAVLGNGKRLRPFLVVSCACLFGVSREASLIAASAIEFIHTYSLIHDDLPAMDDDDLRRGKPACHIQYGEAAAILAGDALQALAFQLLSDPSVHSDPAVRCELVHCVAKASGSRGLVGGQMLDLDAENKEMSLDEIIRLQRLKTGELFAISCEMGAILGKGASSLRMALRRYANDIGLAFQITDDLLDAEGTREEAGKAVAKDATRGKATLVSALGIERARMQANILARQAVGHLEVFDKKANHLRALAEYVVTRRS